jgi:hypothetical protein
VPRNRFDHAGPGIDPKGMLPSLTLQITAPVTQPLLQVASLHQRPTTV